MLRPGGLLAIFGHVYEPPIQVARPFAAAFRRVVPNSPFTGQPDRRPLDLHQAMYTKIGDKIREVGQFHDPDQWRFDGEHPYTRDQWLDPLPTTGGLTQLQPGQTAEILDEVGRAIDALGGRFTMPCTTLATTARRLERTRTSALSRKGIFGRPTRPIQGHRLGHAVGAGRRRLTGRACP